ncbi:serine/threonine protein kinase [Fervidobacterium thailandense]|uniref:non-specific serine/threonine protein kinase n=1 Tax=Fervidobacterium thailandense TaxID=1008305 RepID=A0A1E3G3E9_9BACT|nr:protein kinase [Fervidobacterium thailandense]ODN30774.1 hypothetical protein A4H02_04405 [Fervidobacterium thailandense]
MSGVKKADQEIQKIGENILKIRKGNREILVPEMIGNRYLVEGVLSASSGFGLILFARDLHVFGRKVLIKARDYKGRVKRENLDNKEFIAKARADIEFELKVLEVIRQINVPNTPVLRDWIRGYCPSINWPEGYVTPGKPYLNELAYDEPYIVLQYVEGEPLSDYLERNLQSIDLKSPEWIKLVLSLSKQLLKMFRKMYKIGTHHEKIECIVYQDLKPENIIVTPSENFVLIDFGGAAVISKDGRILNYGVSTPGYLAPEVEDRSMKDKFNHRADIYSLGVLMYQMLTGIHPQTTMTLNSQVANLNYGKLSSLPHIQKIIQKATRRNPDERYQTPDEMLEDIREAFNALGGSRF